MDRGLNGINPLSYMGVNPYTPPDLVIYQRPPTENDFKNMSLGTYWLDNGTNTPPLISDLYILVSVTQSVGIWRSFSSSDFATLTGDTGGPVSPDANDNIFIVGGTDISVAGNPGTNTLTINFTGAAVGFVATLTGDSGGAVMPDGADNINVITNVNNINSGASVQFIGNVVANTLQLDVTDAGNSTYLGLNAGSLAIASNNSAFGAESLSSIVNGSNNCAFGFEAGTAVDAGSDNVMIGYLAMFRSTTSNSCVAVGSGALGAIVAGADSNTAIGAGAGSSLTTGTANLMLGFSAGVGFTGAESSNVCIAHDGVAGASNLLVIGKGPGDPSAMLHNYGTENIFLGDSAGNFTLTVGSATQNVGVGAFSAQVTTGARNTCAGVSSGSVLGSGNDNVAIGYQALVQSNDASNCIAIGSGSLVTLVTAGDDNIAIGYQSAANLVSGSLNIAIGSNAGSLWDSTESNNIAIGTDGVVGESNVIRIGALNGGETPQTQCFIQGIRGITTVNNDAIPVLIDSDGQLGTISSSGRYKENVADMGSNSFMSLRPVEFNYRGDDELRYGLIAEEVATAFPYLAVFNKNGLPETVKYHEMGPLLLKELQSMAKKIEQLEQENQTLSDEIKKIYERLEAL